MKVKEWKKRARSYSDSRSRGGDFFRQEEGDVVLEFWHPTDSGIKAAIGRYGVKWTWRTGPEIYIEDEEEIFPLSDEETKKFIQKREERGYQYYRP